jgi:hypothetical protein
MTLELRQGVDCACPLAPSVRECSLACCRLPFLTNSVTGGNGIGPSPVSVPSGGGAGKGGAIYDAKSTMVVRSTFVGNIAQGGTGSPANRILAVAGGDGGWASGGAVDGGGLVFLTNCTFVGNQAVPGAGGPSQQGFPGGIVGRGFGGAVFEGSGTTIVAFSTLASNSAPDGGALHSIGYGVQELRHGGL